MKTARQEINKSIGEYHLRLGYCPLPFYTLTPIEQLEPNIWDADGVRVGASVEDLSDWDSLCEALKSDRSMIADSEELPSLRLKRKSPEGGYSALVRNANAWERDSNE